MKRLMLGMLALVVLSGSTLFAQNITGTWQGTLHVGNGRELRIVFKISTTETDSLKAVLYSIDQGGQGIIASAVTLKGSAVTISVPAIGGTYQGRLNGGATALAGTWTQGPQPLTLNLERATPETAWTIPPPPPRPKPMPASANPSFEVATIKPTKPGTRGKYFRVRGRLFSTLNTSLGDLMTFSYGIQERQIVGAPAWLRADRYDILAEPNGEGQPNLRQWKIMVQKLMADRFQLKFHREKKELSVYAIIVGRHGPKLTKSQGDPNGLPGLFFSRLRPVVLNVRNATMTDFASLLQSAVLDRPVVDQTGLTGRYVFTLTWTPDQFQFVGTGLPVPPPDKNADAADAPPGLFAAIQQQLGLKLKPTQAPAEVLVIDHVERPSPN
jgi:uncharacterized protein (TIGR03435 family)